MDGQGPSLGILLPLSATPFAPAELRMVRDAVRSRLVDGLWVRDLPVVPHGDPDAGQGGEPFAHLAFLAGAGVRPLVMGTASLILGIRHPLVVARAVVGLQHRAKGRFVLGVGTGGKPAINAALGIGDRDLADFAHDWALLRRAVSEPSSAWATAVDVITPPGYHPPPVHLATTDIAKWEAIDGDADGWQTFVTQPDDFLETYKKVCAVRGSDTEVAVRLDATIVPASELPAAELAERGRVRCDLDQLLELLDVWRHLPVEHVLLGLRTLEPLTVLRVVREAWHT